MTNGQPSQPTPHEGADHLQQTMLNAVLDSAAVLNQVHDLKAALDQILKNIDLVIPYELACVIQIEGNTGWVPSVISKVKPDLAPYPLSSPVRDLEIVDITRRSRQPYIVYDTQTDEHWVEAELHKMLRSAICVPLFSSDDYLGCLLMMAESIGFFTPKMSEHLQRFSALISLAIHNAELNKQAKELSLMQDRQQYARELHDSLTQTIFSASTLAEALKLLGDSAEKAPNYIDLLANMTREAMTEMRSLLFELHPETLMKTDLALVIKQLCDTFSLKAHIPVDLTVSGNTTVPENVHFAFYRIAQETLDHIRRHSRATRVKVTLLATTHDLELRIEDDCPIIEPHEKPLEPCLLGALRERAEQIKAYLSVHKQPGTRIVLQYKLPYLAS